MAILAECPICHRKQATKNKHCSCGNDMDKSKRSKKVRYWISLRLPGGKQRRELVGNSIEKARDADGKRRSQKRENRIFDMLPESNMTFRELSDWYLELKSVKKLASYERINIALNKFNAVFGDRIVNTILPVELEDYQDTGMRPGEVRTLKWEYIDRKAGFIRLPASTTKEDKEKNIPINHHVKVVLDDLVPPLES